MALYILRETMKKPNNYYCHRSSQYPQLPSLPQNYQVLDKIGQGAFGQVYKIFNKSTSSIQVMKINKGDMDSLSKQSQVMTRMNQSQGFAKINQTNSKRDYLIMTLLGDSLGSLMEKCTIGIVDLKRIAYQCLLRLKEMHERGYVHRDIKPDNLLLGNYSNPHKIYFVDFGLSSQYKKTAKIARKCYPGEIGTIKYCPLASHYGLQQFPKDDLESLGYTLIYLISRQLPWNLVPKDLQDTYKFQIIRKLKEQTQINKLCQDMSCLKKYLKAVKELKVGEGIDYNKLLNFFYIDCKQSCCYSFCSSKCLLKQRAKEEKQNTESQFQQNSSCEIKILTSGIVSERRSRIY